MAMAEGKLFAHEATCSKKPKVKMQMVKVGERAPVVTNKKGKKIAAVSQAKENTPANNWRTRHNEL